jgi:hypothetical protein
MPVDPQRRDRFTPWDDQHVGLTSTGARGRATTMTTTMPIAAASFGFVDPHTPSCSPEIAAIIAAVRRRHLWRHRG